MKIDDILKKFGLTYEELSEAELKTLNGWLDALKREELTVDKVKSYISEMKSTIEDELANIKEVPSDWVSALSLFIPFLGIVRKWYEDHYQNMLKARLKNYILLELFLTSPERAKVQIEKAVKNLKPKNT